MSNDPTGILGAISVNGPVNKNLTGAERAQAQLKKACQDFESVFVGMMLKEMHKPIEEENALFGNTEQSKIYQDMMDDAVAGQISKTGQFGLGKALYKSLEKTLPGASAATSPSAANGPAADASPVPLGTAATSPAASAAGAGRAKSRRT